MNTGSGATEQWTRNPEHGLRSYWTMNKEPWTRVQELLNIEQVQELLNIEQGTLNKGSGATEHWTRNPEHGFRSYWTMSKEPWTRVQELLNKFQRILNTLAPKLLNKEHGTLKTGSGATEHVARDLEHGFRSVWTRNKEPWRWIQKLLKSEYGTRNPEHGFRNCWTMNKES